MTKPLLLLDVDGPLNPYAFPWHKKTLEGYVSHRTWPRGFLHGSGLKVHLNPSHGPSLLSLDFDLVWATAWEEEANKWIGPHIGLPELPWIDWKDKDHWNPEKVHWKTKRIAEYVDGRDFVWVDDEITANDARYLKKNCLGTVGMHAVSPDVGLTAKDFSAFKEFRESL